MSWSTEDIPDQSGRIAVVTGANGGLGLETARAFAQAGAHVVLASRNQAKAEDAEEEIRTTTPHASLEHVELDLGSLASVAAATEAILASHDAVDILVNNAGVILRKPAVETTDAEFSRLLDINLVGLFGMTAAVSGHMAKNGYGRVISLSSIMGHIGRAGQATYVAAKHGVVGLTKSFAAEYGPDGITVNAIGPGYFYTDMNAELLGDERFVRSVEQRTPLRRWADPAELAGPIVFLAAPASSFVTGQFFMIDGGLAVTVPAPGQGN